MSFKEYLLSIGEINMTEQRPWGYFVVLEDEPTHKVKRIVVNQGQRLSLQTHEKRDEMWYILEGTALVTTDDHNDLMGPRTIVKIPRGTKHRIKNVGQEPVVFIEVQTGEYFGEDDIVRYSDDYGRE